VTGRRSGPVRVRDFCLSMAHVIAGVSSRRGMPVSLLIRLGPGIGKVKG
jgi:hypothetical protein